jgi:hypothetical protein
MATLDLKELARRGAAARLTELQQEMDAIRAAFPGLVQGRAGRPSPARTRSLGQALAQREDGTAHDVALPSAGTGATKARARKRRAMTAAERKAVGERMRKYWAARRAESSTKKR